MLYLLLIVIPAVIGLILGFTLPGILMAVWRRRYQISKGKNTGEKERRLLCIR